MDKIEDVQMEVTMLSLPLSLESLSLNRPYHDQQAPKLQLNRLYRLRQVPKLQSSRLCCLWQVPKPQLSQLHLHQQVLRLHFELNLEFRVYFFLWQITSFTC